MPVMNEHAIIRFYLPVMFANAYISRQGQSLYPYCSGYYPGNTIFPGRIILDGDLL